MTVWMTRECAKSLGNLWKSCIFVHSVWNKLSTNKWRWSPLTAQLGRSKCCAENVSISLEVLISKPTSLLANHVRESGVWVSKKGKVHSTLWRRKKVQTSSIEGKVWKLRWLVTASTSVASIFAVVFSCHGLPRRLLHRGVWVAAEILALSKELCNESAIKQWRNKENRVNLVIMLRFKAKQKKICLIRCNLGLIFIPSTRSMALRSTEPFKY